MIQDLALILIVAGIVTLLFRKLKQPLVLGYIVAGFLVSSHMPILVPDVELQNIREWADIGVMFTLFSLGLDFSFKKIVKMGAAPIIASMTIVFCMMMLGYTVGQLFNWSHIDCVFLGGMLAMSSTTIIYKAFADLGVSHQGFASMVMSVLILEDILAIVLMVMLSAIASGENIEGGDMLASVLKIGFFLILWFVVGIFAIPLFLKKTRSLMTGETLLVVSIGLCCLMAVISSKAGFSEAFGAFVMGSILAETVEAEKIIKVTESIKNLFGAIFFVSVGMLVDTNILYEYSTPIIVLVLSIIIGQTIFGTLGYFLSGQSLHNSIKCGFSMTQIGEFSFIIASLGMSMHVIADYLYPVIVAVSVITTFTTPYMIRGAEPAYAFIEKKLPKSWIIAINSLSLRRNDDASGQMADSMVPAKVLWKRLLRSMVVNTVVYSILIATVTYLMLSFFLIFSRTIIPHWWANGLTGVLTVVLIAPFMRAIIIKKNHSTEWQQLWNMSVLNRLPLISTVVARAAICLAFLFYICNYLARFTDAVVICLGVIVIVLIVISRSVKQRSIKLERLFMNNLRSRDIAAQVKGAKMPAYGERLVERDLNLSEIVVPAHSLWSGQTLAELKLAQNFGVHVASILRDGRRLNIPYGKEKIFSGDRLQVIGSDAQISRMNEVMLSDVYPLDSNIFEEREMLLRQVVVTSKSFIVGKSLRNSHLREEYALLVVGMESESQELTKINPDYIFERGDVLWIVGERSSIEQFGL
ncbi:sodium:proton antiporter [Prevotella sp. PINT]|jgi:Kef-type K+ transport systems, membrane components|uniref:cation:proton antiporter n=1 Tax=Palleniella intestinalis TaxID=2736291 RepID=UPI0015565245|nr:cation:proton antiporter [Palleniella intestinalis]NPD80548.1 sodium:proton antiporter [Palleniella intestinalis]